MNLMALSSGTKCSAGDGMFLPRNGAFGCPGFERW
jgi:hypothetical protein